MTNEDLLQQAKDQVAKEAEYKEGVKYEKWAELMAAIAIDYYQEPFALSFQQLMYSHKASLLAIQSAREEAAKELKEYKEHCEHLAQQIRMLGECRTDQIKTAREEAAPKWIPVKERLPERYGDCYTSETVLVYTTSTYTFMGYYNHKVNGWGIIGDENLREIHVVTHWMPKPERPI